MNFDETILKDWEKRYPQFVRRWYPVWLQNSLNSIEYCQQMGDKDLANQYQKRAEYYKQRLEEFTK